MIASLAAVGLAPGIGSTPARRGAPVDEGSPIPEETPTGLLTFGAPEDTIDVSQNHEAVITTDRGPVVIALNANAPNAANSFAFLAGQNFYDGLEFFWVLPEFDIQAGDPTCESTGQYSCTGTGGPGYTLPKEGDATQASRWAVIAPVTSPGSDQVHGSQLVIALGDALEIEGTVIGQVVDGQEILESLQERVPCFGFPPSESNPCQTQEQLEQMPPALTIQDIEVRPA